MNTEKIMIRCGICDSQFQFGPHIYEGKHITSYQLMVCKSCWDGNWDGWSPSAEVKLIAHLEKNNIPIPTRNNNGILPREQC